MSLDDNSTLANNDSTTPVQRVVTLGGADRADHATVTVPDGFVWELISVGCQVLNASGTNNELIALSATTPDGKVLFTSPLSPAVPIGQSGSASWGQDVIPTSVTDDQGDYFALSVIPTGILIAAASIISVDAFGGDLQGNALFGVIGVVNETFVTGSDQTPVMSSALREFAHELGLTIASALPHA